MTTRKQVDANRRNATKSTGPPTRAGNGQSSRNALKQGLCAEPSKNAGKTVDGKFTRGNRYGRGRPEGSRNKATLAAQTLLDGEAEALTRKVIDLALSGDITALRL